MLQVAGICQEAAENERAGMPWLIVSFSGAMCFALIGTNANLCKFFTCAFQRKQKAPKVSSGSVPWKNMLQVAGICQEAAENERAGRAPLAWFIVSFSGAMYFALTGTNADLCKFFICAKITKTKTKFNKATQFQYIFRWKSQLQTLK